MRKNKKIWIGILAAMTLGVSMTAYAGDTAIRYEGNSHGFVTDPSGEILTDMFQNFKNVMPGDTLTQKILVKNKDTNRFDAKIYLRSLGGVEDQEFLSQMNLRVVQEANTELFNASSEQTAGLGDWVLLGTVKPGGEIVLNAELQVPITMGNEFQDKAGKIQWEFKVEEIPRGGGGDSGGDGGDSGGGGGDTTPPGGDGLVVITDEAPPLAAVPEIVEMIPDTLVPLGALPKTGDTTNLTLWMILAVLSGCGLAGLIIGRKRIEM